MTAVARITAVDRFIKGCREDGIYDDLNACCVMAGWDGLAGALTPLKGSAPTNSGLSNYDRGIGITGDGSSKYLDSNRVNNANGQDDFHLSAYASVGSDTSGTARTFIGALENASWASSVGRGMYCRGFLRPDYQSLATTGLYAVSRNDASSFRWKVGGASSQSQADSSQATTIAQSLYTFANRDAAGSPYGYTDATLSFYSIGSSLGSDPATGLAALDARVSTLMADLRAIEEAGFDRDAIAYIRAVEEADGAYLETSVKTAINNLVSGLKADGLWDAIGSSCLLCGPRTLAGALVPLRGDAPTSYGFVEGDYDRQGLTGDYTSYLDTGYAYNQNQDNEHMSLYRSAAGATTQNWMGGGNYGDNNGTFTRLSHYSGYVRPASQGNLTHYAEATVPSGFAGVSRSGSAVTVRYNGSDNSQTVASKSVSGITSTFAVFAVNYDDIGVVGYSNQKASFYSIGTFLDLSKMDSHITAYVTAIGAAI